MIKYFLFFLILISCECPTNLDTERSNTPSSNSNVDAYNHTASIVEILNNNVEIEILENDNNGYNKYFSGNPSISFKIEGRTILRKTTELGENLNYTMLIYELNNKFDFIISDDSGFNNQEIFIRIFNLNSKDLTYDGQYIKKETSSKLFKINSDLKINDELSIVYDELQPGLIHNFILEETGFIYFN